MRPLAALTFLALLLTLTPPAWASKFAGNAPYITTMESQSVFYARSIPDDNEGDKGTTQIMRVAKDADQLLTTYPWYGERGLLLGWSPLAGKVGVMRHHQQIGKPIDTQIELTFYLGDQTLKSYTTNDLIKLGATTIPNMGASGRKIPGGLPQANYTAGECRQVPGTNDYYFFITLDSKQELKFDIQTGKLCRVEQDPATNKPHMVLID